jgi:hypothetical protein
MASWFGSGRAQRHADEMYKLEKKGAQQQQQMFDQTAPMYQQALQYFQNRANPQMMGPGTSQQPQYGPAMQAFQALSPQHGGQEFGMQQQAMQPGGPNRNGGYFRAARSAA